MNGKDVGEGLLTQSIIIQALSLTITESTISKVVGLEKQTMGVGIDSEVIGPEI